MESLPDDVWHQILQKGIQAGRLDHVDLCSLAIVNSHFDQLTQEPALWATLLSRDFHLSCYSFEAPSKAHYRRRHRYMTNILKVYVPERTGELGNPKWLTSGDTFSVSWVWFVSDFDSEDCARLVNSIYQLNLSNVTSGEDQSVLPLHEERDQVLPNASQPSLKQAHNRYYENKRSKRFDKSSRPKVVPNSKSYIPMNRPPRRSMARKV